MNTWLEILDYLWLAEKMQEYKWRHLSHLHLKMKICFITGILHDLIYDFISVLQQSMWASKIQKEIKTNI